MLSRMQGPILIAVDGSPAAAHATAVGLDLAAAQGVSVVLIHFSPIAGALFAKERETEEDISQETLEREDPVLRAAAEAARGRGVEFELEIADEHGTNIAAAIAGIAEGKGAAMIVVGTRGLGAIAGAVLGSVSHGLLGLSRLPVVVVAGANAD